MSADEPGANLTFQVGPQKGKVCAIRKAEFVLGTEAGCDLKLEGNYISPRHAVISKREDQYVLKNESINGTLVNNQRIDTHILRGNDLIQVGAEVLLRFDRDEKKKKKARKAEKGGENDRKPEGEEKGDAVTRYFKNPFVIGGLSVYFVGIIVLFVYLGSLGGKSADLSARPDVEKTIEKTRHYLESGFHVPLSPEERAAVSAEPLPRGSDATARTLLERGEQLAGLSDVDPRNYYLALRALQGALEQTGARDLEECRNSMSPDSLQKRVVVLFLETESKMLDKLERIFFSAWRCESRERWAEARKYYRKAMDLIPDPQASAFRYASLRLNSMKDK